MNETARSAVVIAVLLIVIAFVVGVIYNAAQVGEELASGQPVTPVVSGATEGLLVIVVALIVLAPIAQIVMLLRGKGTYEPYQPQDPWAQHGSWADRTSPIGKIDADLTAIENELKKLLEERQNSY